ncbi:hypothetical protein BACCAP_04688 [Pseudoflavonifractor capillosus ATCC 29799]|uniref:Uncharacterized protein n=1 Tax=Pseudoflavonifractor capillosus ATCC 29799 TaxID=411467 RepID=A6P2F7_9FIRM|nr:hypothetical protein BACCAP_04688 [Pseudoflavonifractor capillosus ATCC 29799]
MVILVYLIFTKNSTAIFSLSGTSAFPTKTGGLIVQKSED